jgi:hypothetical protein
MAAPSLSPPTAEDRERCLAEGERYGDSWVLDGADCLIVAPGRAHVRIHDACAGFFFMLAISAAAAAVAAPDLEKIVTCALSLPLLSVLGLSVMAAGRMWFWLKLGDSGFVYERGGAWFPLGPLSLEGPLSRIEGASLRSVKASWYDVVIVLGSRKMRIAREHRERAQHLCDALNLRIAEPGELSFGGPDVTTD